MCAKWVSRMLIQKQKDHRTTARQELLHRFMAERDIFLDQIVNVMKRGVIITSRKLKPVNKLAQFTFSSIKESNVHHLLELKEHHPFRFLESGATANIKRFIKTLTKLNLVACTRPDRKKTLFLASHSYCSIALTCSGPSAILVVVVTRPLSRNGGMAEDMKPQKPGNFPWLDQRS